MIANKLFYGETLNGVYREILSSLVGEQDNRIHNKTKEGLSELVNCSFEVSNPRNCFATVRDMSMKYLEGEMEFYLSGSPLLQDIAKLSKFWERCSDDGVTINSNYGKLLIHDTNTHGNTQFQYARDMLLQNPESKKAVMMIYSPNHSYKSSDNPCTLSLQFLIRDGEVNLYVKMRSSDVWYGLPYDVPFFVLLQFMMRDALAKQGHFYEVGVYNHNAGSLHLYDRNREQAEKVVWGTHILEYWTPQKELFEKYIEGNVRKWNEARTNNN